MTTEIYQLKVDGEIRGSGTISECIDEIYRMRMHGAWFQRAGESVELTLIKEGDE